jgi:hypothetical protein
MSYRDQTEAFRTRIADLERETQALERRLERFSRASRRARRRRLWRASLFVMSATLILWLGAKWLVVPAPASPSANERAMAEALVLRDAVVQNLEAGGECLLSPRALLDHARLSHEAYRGDTDRWHKPWRIMCHVAAVQSAGPDREFGTADDVVAVSDEQGWRVRRAP